MYRWEQEILDIQRTLSTSACSVILVELDPRLCEVYSFAITLADSSPLPMTFEQANIWLQEREQLQVHSSIFLFDASKNRERDRLLAQLREARGRLSRSLTAIGMTLRASSEDEHPDITVIVEKPRDVLRELRTHLLQTGAR